MSGDHKSEAGESAPLPRAFGRYLLLHSLGKGGMADVYLAKQIGMAGIERYCVVKIVATTRGEPQHNVARFVDEARLVVHLSHQNICSVSDVGEVDGQLYLAMDFIAGQNINALLRARKNQSKPMELGLSLFVLNELLKALDYAHRCTHPTTGKPLGIVHRDVSPENILLSYEGEVKLIDFGVAFSSIKQEKTRQGFVLGKLTYISPEQARGGKAGVPADIFAAGIVGYELITGERYYAGLQKNWLEVISAGDHIPRDWGKIDPDLGDVLSRALRREPPTRYDSAAEFRKAIEQYQRGNNLTAGSDELRAYLLALFPEKPEENRKLLARFAGAAGTAAATAAPPTTSPRSEATAGLLHELMQAGDDADMPPAAPAGTRPELAAVEQAFPSHDTENLTEKAPAAAVAARREEPTVLVKWEGASPPGAALTGTEATVLIHMEQEPEQEPFEPVPPEPPPPIALPEPPPPLELATPAPAAAAPMLEINEPLPPRRGPPTQETFLAVQKRRAARKVWTSVAAVVGVALGAVAVLVAVSRDASTKPDERPLVVDAAVRLPTTLGAAIDAATVDAAEKEGVEFAGDEIDDVDMATDGGDRTGRTGDRHTGKTRKHRPRDTGSKSTGSATDSAKDQSPAPTTMSEKLELLKKCKRPCARQVLDKSAHLRDLDFEVVKKFPTELDRCVRECRR